jgi:hypothetical protein
MSHQPPEPRSQPAPDTRSTKCRGCGFFIDACHCAGAEFHFGDIVVRKDNPDGPRYRVEQAAPGWFAAHRIRKDGRIDRREYGFSASPNWYRILDRQSATTGAGRARAPGEEG